MSTNFGTVVSQDKQQEFEVAFEVAVGSAIKLEVEYYKLVSTPQGSIVKTKAGARSGSGILMYYKNILYAVTNHHVIREAMNISVIVGDRKRTKDKDGVFRETKRAIFPGRIFYMHPDKDIAFCVMVAGNRVVQKGDLGILIDGEPVDLGIPAPPRARLSVSRAESLICFHHALGKEETLYTTGEVNGFEQVLGNASEPLFEGDYFENPGTIGITTNLVIAPGSSGSPVFKYGNNENLVFVGLINSGYTNDEINSVIPSTAISHSLSEMERADPGKFVFRFSTLGAKFQYNRETKETYVVNYVSLQDYGLIGNADIVPGSVVKGVRRSVDGKLTDEMTVSQGYIEAPCFSESAGVPLSTFLANLQDDDEGEFKIVFDLVEKDDRTSVNLEATIDHMEFFPNPREYLYPPYEVTEQLVIGGYTFFMYGPHLKFLSSNKDLMEAVSQDKSEGLVVCLHQNSRQSATIPQGMPVLFTDKSSSVHSLSDILDLDKTTRGQGNLFRTYLAEKGTKVEVTFSNYIMIELEGEPRRSFGPIPRGF